MKETRAYVEGGPEKAKKFSRKGAKVKTDASRRFARMRVDTWKGG